MKSILHTCAALAALGLAVRSHAIVLAPIDTSVGTLHKISPVSDPLTGAGMAGMGVQVTFFDGTVYNTTWQATGPDSGGVGGAGLPFSITQTGDTGALGFSWTLSNLSTTTALRSVTFDALAGNTVFDVSGIFSQSILAFEGTPGSSFGSYLQVDTTTFIGQLRDVRITYTDAATLPPSQPVGDLFGRLTIEFVSRTIADGTDNQINLDPSHGLLGPQESIRFRQDTDSIAFVQGVGVPDGGATLVTFAISLSGLGVAGRLCARERKCVS